ncbi:hypothetical protein [Amycolatopsis sp. cmx-4-68]|uniref:hypothetical protein n=1 Tax=Amycolatopsis sp. cmx-4-68 TaxID=2790938 RepID=UPI00397B7450
MPETTQHAGDYDPPEAPAGPAQGASPAPGRRVHAESGTEQPLPDDDDLTGFFLVGASIFDPEGIHQYANVSLPDDATDEAIAAQLLASTLAVAALRGPGVAHALTEKLAALR